jgi:hypothetical protein
MGVFKGALIVVFAIMLTTLCAFISQASAEKNERLFLVERNQNRNVVHYDVCRKDNNELCDSNTVKVYWILEGGKREELNSIEKKYAFGIKSMVMQDENVSFSVAALENLIIAVEKINGKYKAVTTVRNREIVLEKVYVNSTLGLFGMPQVSYIDYKGCTRNNRKPVTIRVVPDK